MCQYSQFLSISSLPFAKLWLIRLQVQFPILRTRSCPDLYPLIRPPKRPLTLGRGRILIQRFVRSSPTLAVYDVVHSLSRGGVGWSFLFTEDETLKRFFSTFREFSAITGIKYLVIISHPSLTLLIFSGFISFYQINQTSSTASGQNMCLQTDKQKL